MDVRREDLLLQKVRSPEGRKLATTAIVKQLQPSPLKLATLQQARSATAALLRDESPAPDEWKALDAVLRKALRKRRPDDTMVELYARYRDGSTEEREVVKSVLIEMGKLAYEEQGATRPRFKLAKQRRNIVGGGSFFR